MLLLTERAEGLHAEVATEGEESLRPFISVIVPIRNEERFIRATLEQLLKQDYGDRYEVIVADGRSTDRTREIVTALQKGHGNLVLVDNPGRLSSAGRNAAIRASRGSVILLVDGHCEIDGPGYLTRIAAAFARSGADCLGRPQPLDIRGAGPLQRAIAAARSCRIGHHPSSFMYSAQEQFVAPQSVAVCYRRSVFDRVGLFDEQFDACEDVEFNHRVHRAGLRCLFTPSIAVRYYPRDTLAGLFRQLARYGRGRFRLLKKHSDTFSPLGFVPAVFVAWLLGGLALSLVHGLFLWPYVGSLLLYAAIVLAYSAGLGLRRRDSACLLLPAVFFVVHFASGWGVVQEVFVSLARWAPGFVRRGKW